MKRRFLSAAFAATLAIPMCLTFASAIDLVVDGEALVLDVEPQIVENRTLVPLRAIFEKLGAEVTWDQDLQKATAKKNDDIVEIVVNDTTAYHNGEATTLDVPAMVVDNRILVPVRFVSEALKATVSWDQDTQTVSIATSNASTLAPVTTVPPVQNEPAPVKTSGTYIGSLESDKYHYPSCRFAKKIVPENEIWFDTEAEATAAGYAPCGVCKP